MNACNNIPYYIGFNEDHANIIRNAKTILLQLPDGLKQYSLIIERCISELAPSSHIIIDATPTFGGCDLHLENIESLEPDIVVHVGHNLYPLQLGSSPVLHKFLNRILFIPAYSRLTPSENQLKKLETIMGKLGVQRVSATSTIQHVNILDIIKEYLEALGYEVLIPSPAYNEMVKGQILGCEYSAIRRVDEKVDLHILVAGGMFHYIGAILSTEKPVVKIDLYEDTVLYDPSLRETYLRKRYYKIMKAMDARHYGIIIGSKTGQYRRWLVEKLMTLLEEKGKKTTMYVTPYLNKEVLLNIDNPSIDAFIITSCPRLPIDDLEDYYKPVLTPGEAFSAISGRIEKYRFPW